MNLIQWDPFRELEDVSSRLNRIFGQSPARTESGNEMLAMADWGMINVTLPKSEKAKSKAINVSVS